MLNEYLHIVVAIDHYNPLGVVRSLGEKGLKPIFISIKGKAELAAKSKYVSLCFHVDTVQQAYDLLLSRFGNQYQEKNRKPFLYFTDDKTMGFMDAHYDELKDKFVFFNAGEANRINRFIDKAEILDLAQECGLNYAKTVVCNKGEIPQGLQYPIITKSISPNIGGWKSDVFICKNKEELEDAYNKIQAPKVLLQQYIDKKNELEFYGVSVNHGQDVLITVAADYLYLIPGYYSPYMNVFNPVYPDVQQKVINMIKKVGFEGSFSCEFLVDNQNQLYFLEINFRNATWSYSSTVAGKNIPYLWADGMIKGELDRSQIKDFESFTAMVEPIDYSKRVVTNKATVMQWAKDFRNCKCPYYYNEQDMEPFNEMCKNFEKLG